MKRFLSPMRLTAVFLTGLMATPSAWAVEAHGGGDQLPQFKPEFYPGELFWLAISFALLYLLLKNKALPRIASVQAQREDARARDLAEAARANEEAKNLVENYEKSLANARAKAQAQLEAITAAAQKEAIEAAAKQQQAFQAALQESQTRVEAMRTQALAHLRDSAADVAAAIVARLTGMQVKAHSAIDAVRDRTRSAA